MIIIFRGGVAFRNAAHNCGIPVTIPSFAPYETTVIYTDPSAEEIEEARAFRALLFDTNIPYELIDRSGLTYDPASKGGEKVKDW